MSDNDTSDNDITNENVITITCSRRNTTNTSGVCGTEIYLVKENLIIMRPKVPLLAAKCPTCGYSNVLKKALSIKLTDEVYNGILGDATDDEDMNDPLKPMSEILAKRVVDGLKMFGYGGTKWSKSVIVIKDFVTDLPEYQNPNGLAQLLGTMKINTQHVPLIVKKAFSKGGMPVDMNQLSMLNQTNDLSPYGVYRPQPTQGYTQPTQGYLQPTISQIGQQQPVITPQPDRNGIVEAPKSEMDSLVTMITLMKEMGALGSSDPTPPTPTVPKEMLDTLTAMTASLAKIGNNNNNNNDEIAYKRECEQRDEVRALSSKLDAMRVDEREREMRILNDRISNLTDTINNPPLDGLNDNQFKVSAQSDNLKTVTGAIESMGAQIVGPLVKMQTLQGEMQAMLMMRQMEGKDGVPSGTYTINNAVEDVPEEQVVNDLTKWRNRVNSVKGDVV